MRIIDKKDGDDSRLQFIKNHPYFSVGLVLAGVVAAMVFDFALVKATSAPASAPSSVLVEQMRIPTCGVGPGCTAKKAAWKFRHNRIRKSAGFHPRQVFQHPAKARRIIARKYKHYIHHRWHTRGRAAARQEPLAQWNGYCTSDTLDCGREWYRETMERRCLGVNNPYPADRNACTEPYRLHGPDLLTTDEVRTTVRGFACGGASAVAIRGGPIGLLFGGAAGAEACWSFWDALHN